MKKKSVLQKLENVYVVALANDGETMRSKRAVAALNAAVEYLRYDTTAGRDAYYAWRRIKKALSEMH